MANVYRVHHQKMNFFETLKLLPVHVLLTLMGSWPSVEIRIISW